MNLNKIKPRAHRTIKIEASGDMFRKRTFPKIRLQGKWLEALGFKQDGRVEIIPAAPGVMLLRSMDEPAAYGLNEAAPEYGKK